MKIFPKKQFAKFISQFSWAKRQHTFCLLHTKCNCYICICIWVSLKSNNLCEFRGMQNFYQFLVWWFFEIEIFCMRKSNGLFFWKIETLARYFFTRQRVQKGFMNNRKKQKIGKNSSEKKSTINWLFPFASIKWKLESFFFSYRPEWIFFCDRKKSLDFCFDTVMCNSSQTNRSKAAHGTRGIFQQNMQIQRAERFKSLTDLFAYFGKWIFDGFRNDTFSRLKWFSRALSLINVEMLLVDEQ